MNKISKTTLSALTIVGFAAAIHSTAVKAAEAPKPPTLSELEAIADRYEKDVAILKSHEDLERLQAIYGYYIDKGLWDQAAALFAKDGTYEFGQRGVYVGPAHIKKALALFGPRGLEPGQLNNYMMLQPIIDVAPDNKTAKARWRSDVLLSRNGKGRWGGGVYENTYVNDHGTWKFQSLHYYVTQESDYDKGWSVEPFPMEGPSKEFPPDRPPTEVYESLPGVYFPAYHFNNPVTDKPVHYGPDKAAKPEPKQ